MDLALESEYLITFQSTPLREGRLIAWAKANLSDAFQSTPLREGRQRLRTIRLCRAGFNPRPCARGDPQYPSHRVWQ